MSSMPVPYQSDLSDLEWLLLNGPDDTEEAPWMTMPDFQWRIIALLHSILRRYAYEHGLPWYLAAELKIAMPRRLTPRTMDLGPDLLMAEAEDRERTSWQVEREGGPPLLVLEVVTEESWTRDTLEKPLLYESMGVQEYAIFAPERKDDGPAVFGYRRDAEGIWRPWEPDGRGMLRSKALGGLRLYAEGKRLRVRDRRGRRLLSDQEAASLEAARAAREAARAEQEAARADQEAARADQEAARGDQEAARADAAEAKLQRLYERYGHVDE